MRLVNEFNFYFKNLLKLLVPEGGTANTYLCLLTQMSGRVVIKFLTSVCVYKCKLALLFV